MLRITPPTKRYVPKCERLEARLAPAIAVGPEFQVNTYTTNWQSGPAVAMDADGDFVVVWNSNLQDLSDTGVYAQRYNAAGVPQGDEFRVNTYILGYQSLPAVAMDADGDFVIAWQSNQDGGFDGIFAQRYNAAGVPQGGEFQVNTYTTGGQKEASIAMDADGDFIIAWTSYPEAISQDGSGIGVFARRFNAAGMPLGNEFQVNTYTTGNQRWGRVAANAVGDFVITWTSTQDPGGSGNFAGGVFAQRYNAAGEPQGGEFQVNEYTTGAQAFSAVDMDADGDFVITWGGEGAHDPEGTHARRFSAAGVPLGADFGVNTYTTGSQQFGRRTVAMDADGDFVVAWSGDGQDASETGVYAQQYSASGARLGAEFRVNSYTTGEQLFSSVAMNADGDFVIAWRSGPFFGPGPDGDSHGIFAQRYTSGGPRVADTRINDGSSQRSRVSTLSLDFSSVVTLPTNPADAFQLRRLSDNSLIGLSATVTNDTATHVTLFFTGPGTEFGSLTDGNYQLTVLASQVSNPSGQLDGNSDGLPGGDYTINFHRLFGDADGNGIVSAVDFLAFRLAYRTGPSIFDFDNDGETNADDFAAFFARYGMSIVP